MQDKVLISAELTMQALLEFGFANIVSDSLLET
jgi:hypothetical protein